MQRGCEKDYVKEPKSSCKASFLTQLIPECPCTVRQHLHISQTLHLCLLNKWKKIARSNLSLSLYFSVYGGSQKTSLFRSKDMLGALGVVCLKEKKKILGQRQTSRCVKTVEYCVSIEKKKTIANEISGHPKQSRENGIKFSGIYMNLLLRL